MYSSQISNLGIGCRWMVIFIPWLLNH